MDTIANMLSTIKNAGQAGKKFVEVPYSRINEEILKVMKEKGFVEDVKVFKPKESAFKMIHVDLKYEGGVSRISQIKRVSKPGRRVYKNGGAIRRIIGGYGISVVSTSQGVMEGSDAKRKKLGGEVLCEVY